MILNCKIFHMGLGVFLFVLGPNKIWKVFKCYTTAGLWFFNSIQHLRSGYILAIGLVVIECELICFFGPLACCFIFYDRISYPWLIMVTIPRLRSSLMYLNMTLCMTWSWNSCNETLYLILKIWRTWHIQRIPSVLSLCHS